MLEYAQIVLTLGAFWIGLRLKFPLIWLPLEEYHPNYWLCDYEEESWPRELMADQGFRASGDDTVGAYNFKDLHRGHNRRIRDFAWGHAIASVGGRCWMWFFTYFLHILSHVLTFLSSRPVPLYDQTPCFLTFLIHFTVMLICYILQNNTRIYSFLWLNRRALKEYFGKFIFFRCWLA